MKQIGANVIAENSITTPKIADNAVTTPKIEDNAVTTSKIADNAVIPNVDERIGSLHNVPPGTSDSQSVFCEAGEQVTGGGFLVNNALLKTI